MRANGLSNFPDPSAGPGGGVGFNGLFVEGDGGLVVDGVTFRGPALARAKEGCSVYLPPSGPPPQPSAAQKAQAVAFARCMRANGVPNFPDPTFNGGAAQRALAINPNSPAVRQYLKFYSCSATFSNALSPVQAATVTKAFEIVAADQGRELRRLLLKRVGQMRDALHAAGLTVVGDPSAIVPVLVGDEALARMVSRRLPELEVIANLVEYPAVAKGNARFRLQMMPTHSAENVKELAARLRSAVDLTQREYARYRARVGAASDLAHAVVA